MLINEILPDEILQKIFSFISVRDRLLFVEKVCSKWNKVINYVDVKELEIFELHEEICRLDFECPFRKASNRPANYPLPEIWLMKFISCILPRFSCSLKSLSFQIQRFSNIQFIGIRIEIMEFVLRICPKLTELNFLRCQLTPTAVNILPLFEHLKSLKLTKQEICDEIWPSLLDNNRLNKIETDKNFGQNFLSHNCNTLEVLRVNAKSSDDGSERFPIEQIVTHYPNLIELDIKNLSLSYSELNYISELRHLRTLSFSIVERTTDATFFTSICNNCHRLEELTIADYQSDGSIDFDPLISGRRIKLQKLSFNSMKLITAEQLKQIKKISTLQTLMLRTNKLPLMEVSSDKSECKNLEELAISSTNQVEKSTQYKIFMESCTKLNKIGYLPRGWSLHTNDGVEPEILERYLLRTSGEKYLIKLLLYARDSDNLESVLRYKFRELTGLIMFGSCTLKDESAMLISHNCPRLAYILTESQISLSSEAVVSLLKCPQLAELHAKYKDLEVVANICYAIGYSSSLKQIGFRGLLMVNKVKLYKKDWDKVMEGRLALMKGGRTCQRVYVDCWYLQTWSKKLAEAFRTLWISCKAAKNIEEALPRDQVIPVASPAPNF